MVSCKKMDHYEIHGIVHNVPDSTIINLIEITDDVGSFVSTDTIFSGKFQFSGTLSNRPTKMNLMILDRLHFVGSCEFWVDYTKIKITGTDRYLSTWNAYSNLSEQKVSNLINAKVINQKKLIDSLSLARIADPGNTDLQVIIRNKIDSISKIIANTKFNILRNNINSQTSLNELYQIAAFSSIDKQQIRLLFEKFDEKYRNSVLGEGIMANLEKPIPPKIGDKFVDLDLHDINGNSVKLSYFYGKYILLDFWSLGCYPCILASPELRDLCEIYENELSIVGISMDVNSKLWAEATKRDSITWSNLSDGKGTYAGASSIYGIYGMPTYILINPQGKIVERWEGFSSGIFKEKVSKYLDLK
jgi:peroxiredoxin